MGRTLDVEGSRERSEREREVVQAERVPEERPRRSRLVGGE